MLKRVVKRLNMFDQTQMKQLIQAAEQTWYACTYQTCLIRGCPNEQNIAHQTREQKKCFTFLIKCLMAFKFYQTRPNTIKHGHQTMFDGVWSPNILICPGPNANTTKIFFRVTLSFEACLRSNKKMKKMFPGGLEPAPFGV